MDCQADNSGSFKEKDNRSAEDAELIGLRKENQQPKMEKDILHQGRAAPNKQCGS